MNKEFNEFSTGAVLKVADQEVLLSYSNSKPIEYYTFIWPQSENIIIEIDGIITTIPADHIVVLTPNQYFSFKEGSDIIVYQFNREFYCIKDHDKEVSCMGVLFYGTNSPSIVVLSPKEKDKLHTLHKVFLEELQTVDTIQAEMLRMLMARFIITTTRLIKQQNDLDQKQEQVDLMRNFNILVEWHFRQEHGVGFYAEKLHRSPKTLSNNFAKFDKTPLQIIHDRIILEAKRLLVYTDKSTKEIAYEVGFEDASHLSRMFKRHTSISPSEFKKKLKLEAAGKY
ncbi:helix-turn-helix domain-containing protein [Aquimarina algicola]|uniref:Helix-turn-helix domain-containing protein n=1 Tax=Aquimarina algicola TaxID=2589995 RepID=A0A504IZV1_9FLAO|nr:helix-turn-helix domain-containing protein [Aquimarina algicola]TPN81672.1 helix-turn-helix domain-containing protein [Aquimarina algicola]